MRRILPVLLAILLVFSGCGMQNTDKKDDDKLKITATIFPQYDFLREITKGAQNIELKLLIPAGKEVHGFETALSDISAVSESDLFVYTGSEDDNWVNDIPENGNKRLALCEIIKDYKDEHVWTSLRNAVVIVESLCNTLCEIDKTNAQLYKDNTALYIEKLNSLDKEFEAVINKSDTKALVFAERFPFLNFAKDYGLNYYSAFEGCSTETEAGIKTINFLIEKVKEENIPAIFTIEFSDGTVAETISRETGAEILQFHSCHNVTEEEFQNGETYLSLMTKNLYNLKTALLSNATGE
ncbi:MAG: zinc ABC transporter substrate-binding protein [Clostridia bacterium]|nr:zinc ABC transporter substrate-binding protein [Clostridia bacterium]